MTSKNPASGLGFLLHDGARLLRRRFESRAAGHGLSAAQWRLLARLLKEGPATQARLAGLLEVEAISVSRLVDRMVEAGWVERQADPSDRRVRMIHPTPRSRALVEEFVAIADEVYAEALAGIPADEQAIMIAGLRRMVANLQVSELAAGAAEEGVQ